MWCGGQGKGETNAQMNLLENVQKINPLEDL